MLDLREVGTLGVLAMMTSIKLFCVCLMGWVQGGVFGGAPWLSLRERIADRPATAFSNPALNPSELFDVVFIAGKGRGNVASWLFAEPRSWYFRQAAPGLFRPLDRIWTGTTRFRIPL